MAWPVICGSGDMGRSIHVCSCCLNVLPTSLCSPGAGARRVRGHHRSLRTELIGAALVAAPVLAGVLGLYAGKAAAHQSINFASADAYVAEHAILHAREFRGISAGAQLRLHR